MEFSLELARLIDASEIARMSRDLIEAGLQWRWTSRRVGAAVRHPRTNVVVACARNGIAGFGIMRYGDDQAHLDLLAVDPEFRRAGLGRLLLGWLEKPALLGGITSVVLEVRERNPGAQIFYERLGYRRVERIANYYDGRESAIRMRHDLAHSGQPVE